jgi:hypothetical protein
MRRSTALPKLARLDRKTANQAIRELAALGELEYNPGTSRYNRSTYRIRVEVLRDRGVDRFRCPLTIGDSPTVTMDETPMVTVANFSADYGRIAHATMDESPTQPWTDRPRSIDTESVKNRSSDQMSDQSARERAPSDDPTRRWVRTEADDVALKAAFEQCRSAAGVSAGEDSEPSTSPDAMADAACPECHATGWLKRVPGGYRCHACSTLSPLEAI